MKMTSTIRYQGRITRAFNDQFVCFTALYPTEAEAKAAIDRLLKKYPDCKGDIIKLPLRNEFDYVQEAPIHIPPSSEVEQ